MARRQRHELTAHNWASGYYAPHRIGQHRSHKTRCASNPGSFNSPVAHRVGSVNGKFELTP
jgi:hypothetical protein